MKFVFRQQKQELEKARQRVQTNVRRSLSRLVKRMSYDAHAYLLSSTPVYSGTAVANFQWSMDAPRKGVVKAASYPIDGLGVTSQLALGQEPARIANEAIATGSLASIDFSDPFRRIYIVNNVSYFPELEYGTYSEEARTPATGIFRGAAAMLRLKYGGKGRVRFTG